LTLIYKLAGKTTAYAIGPASGLTTAVYGGLGDQFFDIILFAMIAGFLVLRLRSVPAVASKRSGRRRNLARRRLRPTDDKVIGCRKRGAACSEPKRGADQDEPCRRSAEIQIADPSFQPQEFTGRHRRVRDDRRRLR
jgi:hypothetical protein